MRHQKTMRKFGRSSSHRRAMFRNLATSLIQHERIETTLHKAKDLRRVVEKLITVAGSDTLHNRRKAYGYLQSKKVVHKLFTDIGPRYAKRPGGYTRVVRTRHRAGDAAEMAVIELVEEKFKAKKRKKTYATVPELKKKKAAKKAEADEAVEAAPAEEVSAEEAAPEDAAVAEEAPQEEAAAEEEKKEE